MQREKGKEPLREAVKRLDERLWHQLEKVWQSAEEGIQDTQKSKDGHQQGTPHCRAVEENLATLIPDDWKGTQFTATDLFILSAAAALHDVGKAGDSPDDHGHISMWEVRDRAMTFGLDQGQAEIVGWVVRAHNDGDLEALPAEPVPLGAAEVDLRPLAALFKLADALHTDYRRVSRQVVEFGGRRAEDNPKTHFRLRVRGWRFDDQGRIELYAVPKDWDDVAVIHTGFEMTRRELEPVVPTLQDAGFPWELALRLDETDLERKARLEVEEERRVERAFVGMDYFTEEDASRFKGRDDDARALWRRVMATPLTLLVGDSGVGKTSLIHAGLFPLLHRARWRTAYSRPFDVPDRFIARDLWRALLEGEPPADATIVDTLARACKAVGGCKLLVVLDQFEDVVRVPLPEMLDRLRRALVAVQAGRFHNLRLLVSYRSDAEAALGPLFQEIAGSDRGLPRTYLQPLSRAGARAALEAGFAEAQVAVSDPLLDAISDELEIQTPMAGVYPPYVQMVGETLCRAAREENESILTKELYRTKGGCEGIIGRYLLQRLAEFGEREEEARRVLVALVRSTGVKGQRPLEELRAETKVDAQLLAQLLAELVDKRMIRHLGGGRYEIMHDHLAQLVDQEVVRESERQVKRLQELLMAKGTFYQRTQAPLYPTEMAELYRVRKQIVPDEAEARLLLHSCLAGNGPAWYWFRVADHGRCRTMIHQALLSSMTDVQYGAALILALIGRREDVPALLMMLKSVDEEQRVERRVFTRSWAAAATAIATIATREDIPELHVMLRDKDPDVRALAQALAETAKQRKLVTPSTGQEKRKTVPQAPPAAAELLSQITGSATVSKLHTMLEHQDAEVCLAAAEHIALLNPDEGLTALATVVMERPEARDEALRLLIDLDRKLYCPFQCYLFRNKNDER